MDAEGIREIFADVLSVRVRRMFGGHGVYDGTLMFALEAGGELYLKSDAETKESFAAAGSTPFVYHKQGKPYALSYWRMPADALDDADELRLWTRRALDAARRGANEPLRRRGSPGSPERPR